MLRKLAEYSVFMHCWIFFDARLCFGGVSSGYLGSTTYSFLTLMAVPACVFSTYFLDGFGTISLKLKLADYGMGVNIFYALMTFSVRLRFF